MYVVCNRPARPACQEVVSTLGLVETSSRLLQPNFELICQLEGDNSCLVGVSLSHHPPDLSYGHLTPVLIGKDMKRRFDLGDG